MLGKVKNQRTMVRRSRGDDAKGILQAMSLLMHRIERAKDAGELLGLEGMSAQRYFEAFADMLNVGTGFEVTDANRVVLCSILPAYDYHWAPGLQPAPKIAQVNAWLKNYAAQKGYVYVDFYSVMKDDRGGLPATLSGDGVHPLPAGFAVMSPLAEAGIEKALKTGSSK